MVRVPARGTLQIQPRVSWSYRNVTSIGPKQFLWNGDKGGDLESLPGWLNRESGGSGNIVGVEDVRMVSSGANICRGGVLAPSDSLLSHTKFPPTVVIFCAACHPQSG